MASEHSFTTKSDGDVKAIDRVVTAFEQAWQRGQDPQIEAFLREAPPSIEPHVFESLLRVEMRWRMQRRKPLPSEHYFKRFPKHRDTIATLFQPPSTGNATATQDYTEEWFYLRNRLPVGPFSFEQLKKLAVSGDLRPKDVVSTRGTPEWKEAATIVGLFSGPSASKEAKQPVAGQWIRDDYVLLEAVGRGGMGEVFKAYRFSLKKEVALKIVRFDRFQKLSPQQQQLILQNFQKEMQATANLRHDHIVSIHDAGDHNGLPFYTMDFVDSNLAKIMQFGPLSGQKAAEYLEKVAMAVDFANQKGIVHRDIKPPNILVDAGKPILADLGLAAVAEKFGEGNERGAVVGTPPYMAPEQAMGQSFDRRTDVYGLGATLYHLITGRPPHQTADRSSILEQVIHEEPLPPRRLNSAIDRDIEAITLKCLEKDPERRYASAGLLAEDLRRYREQRPVSAQRLTWWVRISKWARREPLKAGLLGGILFLLTILFVYYSISNSWLNSALTTAKDERDRAVAAEEVADKKREEAEQANEKARDMEALLSRRVLQKFRKQEIGESSDDLIKHVENCEQLNKKNPSDGIKLDLVESYQELVNYYLRTNERSRAITTLAKCIQLQEELGRKYAVLKVETALNSLDLGALYGEKGDRKEEFKSDSRALQMLEELRDQGFNSPVILAAMGQAHVSLGIDYREKRQMGKTLEHQKEAVRILEQLKPGDQGSVTLLSFQKELGKAYQEVGISLTQLEVPQPLPALEYYEKARKVYEGKSQYGRNSAEINLLIANAHIQLKQPDDALAPLQQANSLLKLLLKDQPAKGSQTHQLQQIKARVLSAQAKANHQKGDAGKAQELYMESLTLREGLVKKGYEPFVTAGYIELAEFFSKENKLPDALNNYDRAISRQEKWIDDFQEDYSRRRSAGVQLFNKGLLLNRNKRFEEAVECFLRAKKHEAEAFRLSEWSAEYGDYLFLTFQQLCVIQLNSKKHADALATVEEWCKIWPDDAGKHGEAAGNLLIIHDREPTPALVNRMLPIFDHALARGYLNSDSIQFDPRYARLLNNPEFAELVKKHRKG